MKKTVIFLLMALLLTGCGAAETFETVADEHLLAVSAPVCETSLKLPEEAEMQVMQNDDGKLYLCDGYALTVQTLPGGDLDRTISGATGFSRANLQVMETRQGEVKRYEAVWSAAGEGEPQVGRVCVLDDGSYHYVLTAMTDASVAGKKQKALQEIFGSFRLAEPEVSTAP